MEKDTHITEVIFRKDKTIVFAMFPYIQGTNQHNSVTGYQHLGQHSSYNYDYCIQTSKKATEIEYKDLFNELTNLGYNLKVISKRNYSKYMKVYYSTLKS